jgi:hypothetical protein
MIVTTDPQSSTSMSVSWMTEIGDPVFVGDSATILEYGPDGKLITSQSGLPVSSGTTLFAPLKPSTTYQYVWSALASTESGNIPVQLPSKPGTTKSSSSQSSGGQPGGGQSGGGQPAPARPKIPSGVAAIAVNYDSAEVKWDKITDPNTSSLILQRFNKGTGKLEVQFHNISKNDVGAKDTGANPALRSGQQYFYNVVAWNPDGLTATATTNVITMPIQIGGIQLTTGEVVGGNPVAGTVSLSAPAPAGGALVNFSSSDGHVTVPAPVMVPAGALNSAQFQINTSPVSAELTVTITGSYNARSVLATLDVVPLKISGISVEPSTITGGGTATGSVTLNARAPAGGVVVNLSVNSIAEGSVPSTLSIASGKATAMFLIPTIPVGPLLPQQPPLVVTAAYDGASASADLQVVSALPPPVYVVNLTIEPSTVAPGGTVRGIVTLNGPAPRGEIVSDKGPAPPLGGGGGAKPVKLSAGGTTVALSSSDTSVATVPSTVLVGPGQTGVEFAIQALRRPIGAPVLPQHVTIIAASYEIRYALLTVVIEN